MIIDCCIKLTKQEQRDTICEMAPEKMKTLSIVQLLETKEGKEAFAAIFQSSPLFYHCKIIDFLIHRHQVKLSQNTS